MITNSTIIIIILTCAVTKLDRTTNIITACGNDRYHFNDQGVLQCCSPHCSAGCNGSSAERCFVSNQFQFIYIHSESKCLHIADSSK